MSTSAATSYRWTRQQYDQMVNSGILGSDDNVELIDGEIVVMAPQNSRHASLVQLAVEALRAVFQEGYLVRSQLPLAVDDESEPEPDVAVVPGRARDYLDMHPTTAALIVEVADTSLGRDRGKKKILYARNGIEEYWIVNIQAETVEVYREPHGNAYRSEVTLRRGDLIQPLAAPDKPLGVAELLP